MLHGPQHPTYVLYGYYERFPKRNVYNNNFTIKTHIIETTQKYNIFSYYNRITYYYILSR